MNISTHLNEDSYLDQIEELSINKKCGHVGELKKMQLWIKDHNTCPICFVESSLNDVIKIYHCNTINETYSQYYKEKYEELQNEMENLKIKNEISMGFPSKIENTLDKLEYEIECVKNKKLSNLLYNKIENGSDFISQNAIEEMIQIEMKAKDELIDILQSRYFEAQISNKLREENINEQEKCNELENKLKEKESEKDKYLSRFNQLQEECDKMEKDNLMLKEKILALEDVGELERIFKIQLETINTLTKENKELEKENKDHNKIINKINQKNEKKYRDLESQYQELKMITDLLGDKIQTFDGIERNLYEFDRNVCLLMSKIMPLKTLTKEPFDTFLNKPQKLGSTVWKMISQIIYARYGKLIKEIGDNLNTVMNIIENDIPIPWSLVEEIQIVDKEDEKTKSDKKVKD
uniref:RING-type domain-containing protein n=1 Tax=Strongyloides papillosus TaxID=174720 RepID=A0A0N5BSW8_STREA